jgi:hypothetical protein
MMKYFDPWIPLRTFCLVKAAVNMRYDEIQQLTQRFIRYST